MADISQITIDGGTAYNIKDAVARAAIPSDLKRTVSDFTAGGVGFIQYRLQLQDGSGSAIGNGQLFGITSGDNVTIDYMTQNNTIKINAESAAPVVMPFVRYDYAGGNGSLTGILRAIDFYGSSSSPNYSKIASSSNSDSFFEIDSGNYKGVKCLVSGTVEISGSVYFTTSTGSQQMGVYIYKNRSTENQATPTYSGTEISAGEYFASSSTNSVRQIAGVVTSVSAGDVINLVARASGSNGWSANKDTHIFIKYLDYDGAAITAPTAHGESF